MVSCYKKWRAIYRETIVEEKQVILSLDNRTKSLENSLKNDFNKRQKCEKIQEDFPASRRRTCLLSRK